MEEIQYWQIDKIESLLQLCPYDDDTKESIYNSIPETREEADELIKQLWFDHIPRDPRDQFDKMIKMNTLVKTDHKYEYICNDCGENWVSSSEDTLCTCCLSPSIKSLDD